MKRFVAALVALVFVAGCENIDDLSAKPRPIGEFALGYNVVVAPNLVVGPASREVEKDVWIKAMKSAIDERFSRYEGDQLYHFGISLEGYVLAQPGLPVVLAPKSVLILKVTVWDDAAGQKLNAEPEQLTVLETLDGETIVGSGLTKTAEEQMETLSVNAAKLIQRWITRKHFEEQWFKKRKDVPQTSPEQSVAVANVAPAAKPAVTAPSTATDTSRAAVAVKPAAAATADQAETEAAMAVAPTTTTTEPEANSAAPVKAGAAAATLEFKQPNAEQNPADNATAETEAAPEVN